MSELRKRDVIITGIPRSGTTLLTAMMDSAPDTVALNEPKWQYDWARENREHSPPEDFAKWLAGDFIVSRHKLLKGIALPERRAEDGSAVTNYYHVNPQTGAMEDTFKTVPFTRPGLTPDFRLAMKHNGLYFGALQQIIETGMFDIYVIVRHPVHVIASWNRAPIPLSRGKMPGAIIYWDQMNSLTRSPVDLLEKQVKMYDLLCKRIHYFRDHVTVVQYEELVNQPETFCSLAGIPAEKAVPFIDRKQAEIPAAVRDSIADAFREHGQFYSHYYPNL